jgi:hypothetical protein
MSQAQISPARGVDAVEFRRFAEAFALLFKIAPTVEHFVEWCMAWGGRVEGDTCVFRRERELIA